MDIVIFNFYAKEIKSCYKIMKLIYYFDLVLLSLW